MNIFKKDTYKETLENKLKANYILKKTFIEFKNLSSEEQENAIKELDDVIKKQEEELERIDKK